MKRKLGKIEHEIFGHTIQGKYGLARPEVVAGPAFGVDVSIVDLQNGLALAMTSDPLSLIPSLGLRESAWLSVHLMVNDIATTGFAPMYGQFVLNLPSSFSTENFKTYWEFIHQFCKEVGVAITGGHTGFIEGQNSTIAGGGTLITVAPKDKLLLSSYAKPGNSLLVTKTCALSSVAILAMSFPETVKSKAGTEIYQKACETFYHSSSLKDALLAVSAIQERNVISAMHDVTEGGVLGAIYELAVASDCGVLIYNDALPIGEVQRAVCRIFELDPRYCVGAGSMIIACDENATEEVANHLSANNIPCSIVGKLVRKEEGLLIIENGKEENLQYLVEDPYWFAYFKALE
ncbi:MAG: AIR synthase family protein, partial [Chitinophagales bacterium]|nr:AIR synthase family protein [Chitinophagales bacterium]